MGGEHERAADPQGGQKDQDLSEPEQGVDERLGPEVGDRAEPGAAIPDVVPPLADEVAGGVVQAEPEGDHDGEEEDRERLRGVVLGQRH